MSGAAAGSAPGAARAATGGGPTTSGHEPGSERALVERIKELNCLYSISKLMDRRERNLTEVLEQLVQLVPAAWQFPAVAAACITLHGSRSCSAGYRETRWQMAAPIIARGETVGQLAVCYLQELPAADEGPFLQEERALLNVIAQRLGELAERKAAEQQVLVYQEQLRSLAQQIMRTEERERRQIAAELHDRIGQSLALGRVKLALLLDGCEDPALRQPLIEVRELIGQTIADTRTLIFELSPPVLQEFGLVTALQWLAEQAGVRHNLPVEFVAQAQPGPLGDEVSAAVFQAARELLANAGRHARCRRVTVTLEQASGELRVTVADDGVGFDVQHARRQMLQERSFGLFSLGERLEQLGGRLLLDSRRDHGTRATIVVPLASASAAPGPAAPTAAAVVPPASKGRRAGARRPGRKE